MRPPSSWLLVLASLCAAALLAAPLARSQDDNLDYWLGHASTAPASQPRRDLASNPLQAPATQAFARADALPAAARLSDGTILAGRLYTTAGKDLELWVADEQRWRHVPLPAVLGIRAVVVSEATEKEWRWREMGSDERVYTGRTRPIRQLNWQVHLADGTYLTGEIKGQPLWLVRDQAKTLLVLHARQKGEFGQSLAELTYPVHIVISLRAMEQAAGR